METELARWLGVDRVEVTQLAGGSSNLTFRVVSEKGDWVLRRPPMVLDATLDAVIKTLEQAEKT